MGGELLTGSLVLTWGIGEHLLTSGPTYGLEPRCIGRERVNIDEA